MLTLLMTYFTDPVLRAPTLGSMLMCLASALVGVVVLLRKQSLLGEALSHAAYPGVIAGTLLFALIPEARDAWLPLFIAIGACLFTWLGLKVIAVLQSRFRIKPDAALCFVLSTFFGVGLTFASHIQFAYTKLYHRIQGFLFGQAATMTDEHILIYAGLAGLIVLLFIVFYKELQIVTFDRSYAEVTGVRTWLVDNLLNALIVLAVVIGIRSVGVVLMSGMLIAPAVAARQLANRLYGVFFYSALIGLTAGLVGNVLSFEISRELAHSFPGDRLTLPTGPMIILSAAFLCFAALLLAPQRGVLVRLVRMGRFRYRCVRENLLRAIWKVGSKSGVGLERISSYQSGNPWFLSFVLWRLCVNGWLEKTGNRLYRLTREGRAWASQVVRLHRLWEVYLVEYCGQGASRVHRSAEEIEHILTPELEAQLTSLLKDPKQDPHDQPIPAPGGGTL